MHKSTSSELRWRRDCLTAFHQHHIQVGELGFRSATAARLIEQSSRIAVSGQHRSPLRGYIRLRAPDRVKNGHPLGVDVVGDNGELKLVSQTTASASQGLFPDPTGPATPSRSLLLISRTDANTTQHGRVEPSMHRHDSRAALGLRLQQACLLGDRQQTLLDNLSSGRTGGSKRTAALSWRQPAEDPASCRAGKRPAQQPPRPMLMASSMASAEEAGVPSRPTVEAAMHPSGSAARARQQTLGWPAARSPDPSANRVPAGRHAPAIAAEPPTGH